MATIQNENKENRLPDLQKQMNTMAAQPRRPALSQRNNLNVNVPVHRAKQVRVLILNSFFSNACTFLLLSLWE